ncbi:hypothetical protein N335_10072, partial [Phaethon lepturus]
LHKDDTIRLVQDKSSASKPAAPLKDILLQMLEGVSGKARNRARSPDSPVVPGMAGFLYRDWHEWAKAEQ